ncbi:MAG: ABC transporter ATP-binding protein [Planctomycetota bacterium]
MSTERRQNWRNLCRFARTYIAPRKGEFAVVQLLHIVAVGLLLVPPLLVRRFIDDIPEAADMSFVLLPAGGIVAVCVLFFLAAWQKEYRGHEIAQNITVRLRNDLYGHFQKLSMSFHDRKKTGGLLARIVDDMNVIQEVVHHGPEALLVSAVMVVGTAGLLFYLNWMLALVVVAFLPLMAIHVALTAGKMWRRFRVVRRRKESLSDELEENLSGIAVIKGFGAEDRESAAVHGENMSHYHSRMSVIRYMALLFPGAIALNQLAAAAVIVVGGWLAIGRPGLLTAGTLTAFVLYLGRFMHPIIRMVMMLEHAGRFFASIERFFDYMDIEPDIRDKPDAVELGEVNGEVAFDDVSFSYDEQPVLKDISFTAGAGQMVALVGPSGAGKTTVVRLIPRFYDPQSGRITLDGRDIRDLKLHSLRSHIATVMQDDFLFSGSVLENIAYGRPEASREEVIEAAEMANAAPFIEEMADGYDTQIGKRGITLSEGQRQRLSIARALLKNPQILLLDEATSSVDPETELLIQKAMDRLRSGRTTFAIAHRLSTIFQADQILFIEGGQIVERGTHRELIAAGGEYARFFDIQYRKVYHDLDHV